MPLLPGVWRIDPRQRVSADYWRLLQDSGAACVRLLSLLGVSEFRSLGVWKGGRVSVSENLLSPNLQTSQQRKQQATREGATCFASCIARMRSSFTRLSKIAARRLGAFLHTPLIYSRQNGGCVNRKCLFAAPRRCISPNVYGPLIRISTFFGLQKTCLWRRPVRARIGRRNPCHGFTALDP